MCYLYSEMLSLESVTDGRFPRARAENPSGAIPRLAEALPVIEMRLRHNYSDKLKLRNGLYLSGGNIRRLLREHRQR